MTIDVFEAIAAGRYKNNVPYSREPVPTNDDMTIRQVRQHKEEQKRLCSEQRALHRIEEARLQDLFKADLEAEHGVTGHPKAGKLFSIAWDRGHSGGYHDVACAYGDMVELIQP